MFKKINSKTLGLIFIVLLIAVAAVFLSDAGNKKSSFERKFVKIDSSKVTQITYFTKKEQKQVDLIKNGDSNWTVTSENKNYAADAGNISRILSELSKIEAKRIVAKSDKKWSKYEVSDSLGIHVIVKEGDKQTADLMLGKFSFQRSNNPYQQQGGGSVTSFVRLYDQETVFEVEGFLSMQFPADISAFRRKELLKADKNDFSQFQFNMGDSSYTLTKQNNKWLADGILTDSTQIDNFLNSMQNLTSYDFVDDNSPLTNEIASLKIQGNNMSPVTITAYKGSSENELFITSSINEGAIFNGSAGSLFQKIFVSKSKLLAKTEESL